MTKQKLIGISVVLGLSIGSFLIGKSLSPKAKGVTNATPITLTLPLAGWDYIIPQMDTIIKKLSDTSKFSKNDTASINFLKAFKAEIGMQAKRQFDSLNGK